jgi:hypothetical protein
VAIRSMPLHRGVFTSLPSFAETKPV